MTYNILTSRYNSLLRIDSEHNTSYYLTPQTLLSNEDIIDYKKELLSYEESKLFTGIDGYAQFRKYFIIDSINRKIGVIDNINLDNFTPLTEKLKLILFVYTDKKTLKPRITHLVIKNDKSFNEFYKELMEHSYAIKDRVSLITYLDHLKCNMDIFTSYMKLDTVNHKCDFIQCNKDIGLRNIIQRALKFDANFVSANPDDKKK